ncbi:hypothetical protein BN11_380014 [Nostocoides australiense Ben110]|uniref:Uncharacterized protein n=1 Tax=Nostocoides australiense Ben110 TaxID=1193182 RepID=W6JY72_9MICO|nr:hypothetical protein [Tetrasphaera australiensis]CCH74082.1 hypothetical protein BN11_380014 [Tetrasphaera australiensis Ben110]
MLQPRPPSWQASAAALGIALTRDVLGTMTPAEEEIAGAAVLRSLQALPDATRLPLAALAKALAPLLRRVDRAGAAGDLSTQKRGVRTLRSLPLPGVPELLKLTGGLALVAVVDDRAARGLDVLGGNR